MSRVAKRMKTGGSARKESVSIGVSIGWTGAEAKDDQASDCREAEKTYKWQHDHTLEAYHV